MLVATRSFTVEIDGETIDVTAGISRVAPDHELTASFPSDFRPATDGLASNGLYRGADPADDEMHSLTDLFGAAERRALVERLSTRPGSTEDGTAFNSAPPSRGGDPWDVDTMRLGGGTGEWRERALTASERSERMPARRA